LAPNEKEEEEIKKIGNFLIGKHEYMIFMLELDMSFNFTYFTVVFK